MIKILEWARKEKPIGSYFTIKEVATGTKIQTRTVYRRLEDLAARGYITTIQSGGGTSANTYELAELGMNETKVEINIMKDPKIIRLLKTISDPKSEKELLSLCDKILREEIAEEKTESESEKSGSRDRAEQTDSKKQLALGE
jgi:DNA-binding PadR family transcriptional regulator